MIGAAGQRPAGCSAGRSPRGRTGSTSNRRSDHAPTLRCPGNRPGRLRRFRLHPRRDRWGCSSGGRLPRWPSRSTIYLVTVAAMGLSIREHLTPVDPHHGRIDSSTSWTESVDRPGREHGRSSPAQAGPVTPGAVKRVSSPAPAGRSPQSTRNTAGRGLSRPMSASSGSALLDLRQDLSYQPARPLLDAAVDRIRNLLSASPHCSLGSASGGSAGA